MRIVLIKGQSGYDALRVFIDDVAAAFTERGYEAVVIDAVAEPDLDLAFRGAAAAGPTTLVFTFNVLGDYRDPDGRSLGQVFGAPHVIQYVDYPLTHWVALDRTATDTALLMIDESHVAAISSVYGADHFGFLGFSPHAAVGEAVDIPVGVGAYAATRPIPILFAGTFYEPELPWWESQQPVIRDLFQRAAEIVLAEDWFPALAALDIALAEIGLDPAAPEVVPFRKLATHIHEHVRAVRRRAFLRSADGCGLPIHVYGQGYEPEDFPNFTHGGPASLREVVGLMGRSRLVVNINANFGAGSHERPLTALLAGAASATDHSSFYEARFVEGQELAVYRWGSLEQDLLALKHLAETPDSLHAMANAGQQRVQAEHRWSSRVETILAAAEAARPRLV